MWFCSDQTGSNGGWSCARLHPIHRGHALHAGYMPVAHLWRRVPPFRRIPDTLAGRLHRAHVRPCVLFFSPSAVALCACHVADVRASRPIPTLQHITPLLPQRQVPGKLAPRPARRSPADRNRDAAPKVITRDLLRRIPVRGCGGGIEHPPKPNVLLRTCWYHFPLRLCWIPVRAWAQRRNRTPSESLLCACWYFSFATDAPSFTPQCSTGTRQSVVAGCCACAC